jgi:hypothetical protein
MRDSCGKWQYNIKMNIKEVWTILKCEIGDSVSGYYEDSRRLGCDVV